MLRDLRTSFFLLVVLMSLAGLGYPLLVLTTGSALFPAQTHGSIIKEDGRIIGSILIGQNFSSEGYFHPRPSNAGKGYDAANSSGSNLAATAEALTKAVTTRVEDLKKSGNPAPIPVDLVTSSGSGLDPDISVAAAKYQAARVAAARHLSATDIEKLITDHTVAQTFGFLGATHINVLELNRALDQLAPLNSKPTL